jgi:dsDNA-specific endonuclease/ATPase MutS2
VKGSADIHLRKEGQYQAVDYHLGPVPESLMELFPDHGVSDSRTAMLTGANSGGKTTLLLTLAQVVIMAKMGLPVPAEKAWIPDIDKLFIYKPKRRLDAGGLEAFLRELLPLSTKVDPSSLVLADELEAMTELEAASRIIGIFLEELSSRGAYSVVVTHMADEICRFTECRVDGIEARGLDEKHNLIVDRTPVIGMHARSTPELILRKLEARARGDEKKIYSRVLESFE